MPVWNFHGTLDRLVPIEASQQLVDVLKPITPDVKFTIYPNTYHNSWEQAYAEPELYD